MIITKRGAIKQYVNWQLDLGATLLHDGGVSFRVWAPRVQEVSVLLPLRGDISVPLSAEGNGYFSGVVAGVAAGEKYLYLLDGQTARPDPASRFQPEGVHGPSQVVDVDSFEWSDNKWKGMPLDDYIIYEIHVGTFTPQGTFDGVLARLDYLCELGITAVELMPVAQFPGERNWGYDGVYPFAPQNSYGDPEGLKRLVDACHSRGLAVILDVVYNHLGPEGNYLNNYGYYFTDRYRTPWGDAVNFDGPECDPVRHFFVSNALYWITEYHFDALRLDAVHGIYDFSARHILQELTEAVHNQGQALGRRIHVIAESDQNDVRVINPQESGGHNLDAQWNDDFHHALRALLTGDRTGYYSDFGSFSDMVKAFQEGFVLSGGYSSFRKRHYGSSSIDHSPGKMVVFSQNHDQIGNRMAGERPGRHLTMQQLKLAAAMVLLSPYVPLLFMGEEYAESAPFPYFVSHGDAQLPESVRQGRLKEFNPCDHQVNFPDPQSEATFHSAMLKPKQHQHGEQRVLFDFYRDLIRLRKECAPFTRLSRDFMQVFSCEEKQVLVVNRSVDNVQLICLFNFSDQVRVISPSLVGGTMTVLLDSTRGLSPGFNVTVYTTRPETFPTLAPFGVMIYRKEK